MTVYMECGSSDYFAYVRLESKEAAQKFIDMNRARGLGTAYPDCGWNECGSISYDSGADLDEVTTLITMDMLEKLDNSGDDMTDMEIEWGFYDDGEDN